MSDTDKGREFAPTGSYTMSCNSYYCSSQHCRRTTRHLCVKMRERTFFYCVTCGRRLELREEFEQAKSETSPMGHDHHGDLLAG